MKKLLLNALTLLTVVSASSLYGWHYGHYGYRYHHGGRDAAIGIGAFTAGALVGSAASRDRDYDPVAREEARALRQERLDEARERREQRKLRKEQQKRRASRYDYETDEEKAARLEAELKELRSRRRK